MGIGELAGRLLRDVTILITQPFIDSKEEIKSALEEILDGFSEVTKFLKELITDERQSLLTLKRNDSEKLDGGKGCYFLASINVFLISLCSPTSFLLLFS